MVARLTVQHKPRLRVLRLATPDDERRLGVTAPQTLRVLSLKRPWPEALDKLQAEAFQRLETLALFIGKNVMCVARCNALGRALARMTALHDLSLTVQSPDATTLTGAGTLEDWRLAQVTRLVLHWTCSLQPQVYAPRARAVCLRSPGDQGRALCRSV